MFCVSGTTGTTSDGNAVSDAYVTARTICIRGIDGFVCRAVAGVENTIRELRELIDDAVRACIEGRLDENQVYERIVEATRQLATQLKLDGEEFRRVDTEISLLLDCSDEPLRLSIINAGVRIRRGATDRHETAPEPGVLTNMCRELASKKCSQPMTLRVHYWVAVRHAFDKQRVFGRTDDEHFRYAVLGVDGAAEDEYILADKLVARREDSTVFISLDTMRGEEHLSSIWASDTPKEPWTTIVPAECRDGILRMHIYDELGENRYTIMCKARI